MLSGSPEETRRIGAALASQLEKGDVVLLSGELGAGKSELARGIVQGLGVNAPVTSPTFTLLNLYTGKDGIVLRHFDWYRVEDPEELLAAGLDEYIGGSGITLIEWHERAPGLVPDDCLEIRIFANEDGSREISLLSGPACRQLSLKDASETERAP